MYMHTIAMFYNKTYSPFQNRVLALDAQVVAADRNPVKFAPHCEQTNYHRLKKLNVMI